MSDDHLRSEIRKRLKELGLSAAEASRRTGRNNDSLLKAVLSGKSRHPRLDTLEAIAKVLHCSVADLSPDYAIKASTPTEREQSIPRTEPIIEWLGRLVGIDPSVLALMQVGGDAMEPTLINGDHVLIDQSVRQVQDDGLYAVRLAPGAKPQVRRCSRGVRGLLTVKADNPVYPVDDRVADADLAIEGRVVWLGRSIGG